jgi:hypothetical protein
LRGGFQIDHEVKVDRLLESKSGGLGAFQDLVHIESCAAD